MLVVARAVRRGIIPGRTRLVMVESPTNPRMQICDIRAIAAIARAAGAICCVDNSIMAVQQRPIDLGADISMVSGTKFIGGHGDVTLGILAVKGLDLAKRVYFLQVRCCTFMTRASYCVCHRPVRLCWLRLHRRLTLCCSPRHCVCCVQNAEGAGLAPFDCWLALRGLKTMSLRMERAADNCAKLAAYLSRHPLVKKVNYAGLPSHPGASVHAAQATTGGALLSFETGSVDASKVIVEETKLFKVTVSFGSVTSLISLPCYMSHASIPAEVRAARGLPDDLVRISAGIEHIDDLIADLDQAMTKAMATVGMATGGQAAAAGNGVHAAAAASAASNEQLVLRIRQLEDQVRQLTGSAAGGNGSKL